MTCPGSLIQQMSGFVNFYEFYCAVNITLFKSIETEKLDLQDKAN